MNDSLHLVDDSRKPERDSDNRSLFCLNFFGNLFDRLRHAAENRRAPRSRVGIVLLPFGNRSVVANRPDTEVGSAQINRNDVWSL